jgi:hypothetical protein
MAQLNFNANEYEPENDFAPLEPGEYTAMIVDSELRHTKSGNGQYIALTFEVMDERYPGRKLWENLNIENPNPKAVEIALRKLSSICRAVGIMSPKDTEELHDKMMIVVVGIKNDDLGEPRNVIKGFNPYGQQFSDPAPAPKTATTAPTGKKPWEK